MSNIPFPLPYESRQTPEVNKPAKKTNFSEMPFLGFIYQAINFSFSSSNENKPDGGLDKESNQ